MTTNNGAAQSTVADSIVFTTQPGWADLTECVQCYFACDLNITGDAGCGTNACLCQDSGLEFALDELLTGVLVDCQNTHDQQEATSFLFAYCSDKGYTDAVMVSAPASLTGRLKIMNRFHKGAENALLPPCDCMSRQELREPMWHRCLLRRDVAGYGFAPEPHDSSF
jgi:hypothetical protein